MYYDADPFAELELGRSDGKPKPASDTVTQPPSQDETKRRPGRPSKHPKVTPAMVDETVLWYESEKKKSTKKKKKSFRCNWMERARHYFPDAGDKELKELKNQLKTRVYGQRYMDKIQSKTRKNRKNLENGGDASAHVRFNCSKTADLTAEKVYELMANELNNGRTVYYSADAIHTAVRRYPELEQDFADLLGDPATAAIEYLKGHGLQLSRVNGDPSLWIRTLRNECKQTLRTAKK
jgi:hypothetical protein